MGLRGPIRWFGGKGNLVSKLMKYVPPHTYYCEPFFGGGSLFFRKDPSDFEVINDIDKDLMNFYKVLRDKNKFEEFYRLVNLTLYSRAEYYEARGKFKNEDWKDDIERAYLFFVTIRMSFSGDFFGGWSHAIKDINSHRAGSVSLWLSCVERLPQIHERLRKAQIECLDFRKIFHKYISKWEYGNSFAYIDPPYVKLTRRKGGYRFEMNDDDHKNLIELLLKYQNNCKFMVSGYDNELYNILEKEGWRKICWNVACHAVAKTHQSGLVGEKVTYKKNQRRQECIWINYGDSLWK